MASILEQFDEFYVAKLKNRLFANYVNQPQCIRDANKRFEQMIDYNVPHGKKLRGLCVYESVLLLLEAEKQNEALMDQAKAIGWCIEFLQGSFLIADDMMDNSKTRRGRPCWYLNENVGSVAINDSFFLISNVFTIITEYLGNHPNYSKLFELFNETFTNTVIGQGLDLITPPKVVDGVPFNFENYTEERYFSIVKWKTAFYSFSLPVQAALLLSSIDNYQVHQKCREILIDMGCFFQVQDDFLDCYGDPKVTGKVGTDIEESKCGWLVIQALKKCNPEQRDILEKFYGREEQECVTNVKEVFKQLDLVSEYERYERVEYDRIISMIDNLNFESSVLELDKTEKVKNVLRMYAKKIFKRIK